MRWDNLTLHGLFQLTFLAVFFFAYVTSVTAADFRASIDKVLDPAVRNVAGAVTAVVPRAVIDSLATGTASPSPDVSSTNGKVRFTAFAAIAIAWAVWALAFLRRDTAASLLAENAASIALIGAVEVLFFQLVAAKFDPVPSNALYDAFLTEAENKLKSS